MKKITTALLALTVFLTAATAQTRHAQKAAKHKLAKQLHLSDAQKEQVKTLRQQHKASLQELNRNESVTVKEYRDKKEALHKTYKAQWQQILTPEQRQDLARLKAAKRTQQDAKFASRLAHMKTQLQLSDAQVAQLRSGREAAKAKMRAIHDNQGLDRVQRKAQLMAVRQERKTQLQQLLTPAQQEKWKALHNRQAHKQAAVK